MSSKELTAGIILDSFKTEDIVLFMRRKTYFWVLFRFESQFYQTGRKLKIKKKNIKLNEGLSNLTKNQKVP